MFNSQEYNKIWKKNNSDKVRASRKKWKIKNSEKVKEYQKRYRIKKRGNPICIACNTNLPYRKVKYCNDNCSRSVARLSLRFMVLIRDNFTCQYCGRKAPEVILHVDHIIPKSKNGKTVINNLKTACFECNLGKSNILLTT